MKKNKEIETINIQLITLLASLISVIISILLTYNQKLNLEKKESLFNADKTLNITLFNRILIVVISFIFLYVNYEFYEISKEEGEDLKSYILQIVASIITIIPGLIALYVVFLSNTETVVDVENPII